VHYREKAKHEGIKPIFRRKKSQVQALAAIVFLVLVPTLIIAQNATNTTDYSPDVEGGIIVPAGEVLQAPTDNRTEKTETVPNLTGTSSGGNATPPADLTIPYENETLPDGNGTADIPENQTQQEKEDPSGLQKETGNITFSDNTTNATLPEWNETTQWGNATPTENTTIADNKTHLTENETAEGEEVQEPEWYAELSVTLETPGRIYRGEPLTISARITNQGTAPAPHVSAEWVLPEGFSLLDSSPPCAEIHPGEECAAKAEILAPLDAALEDEEIRILVSYDE
jgi:hypothetical protein